jgi:predicted transcriptional regulator
MKITEIQEILKGKMLCGESQMDTVITAGGASDLMDDVLAAAAKGCVLLTGVTTDHVMRTAKIVAVGAIVIVRGKNPPKEFVEMAKSFEIPLMVTEYSLFVACGRLYMNGIRGLDGSW